MGLVGGGGVRRGGGGGGGGSVVTSKEVFRVEQNVNGGGSEEGNC